MNLILFETGEISTALPRTDPRATHILDVLRRKVGDTFDVGLVDGPLGKGTLVSVEAASLSLAFNWGPPPPAPDPITLLVGLPRPQTARDILRDVTTLGVAAIHFVTTERSDANYAASTLWTSGEWRRHCLTGAAQAFATRLPTVTSGRSLSDALTSLEIVQEKNLFSPARLALDNYEATAPLSTCNVARDKSAVIALGPERGWGPKDREAMRAHGFTLVHLGPRVLRSEIAVVSALTLIRAQLGLM